MLEYRARGTTIVPYRDYALNVLDGEPAIAEVILGPRHATPPEIVGAMLKHRGFGDVVVKRSVASCQIVCLSIPEGSVSDSDSAICQTIRVRLKVLMQRLRTLRYIRFDTRSADCKMSAAPR